MPIKTIDHKWTIGANDEGGYNFDGYYWRVTRNFKDGPKHLHTNRNEFSKTRPPKEMYSVYTENEVNAKISAVKSDLKVLRESLNSTDKKIDDTLVKINQSLEMIPQIILQDETFRKSLKEEILAEIRAELDRE